MSIVVIFLTYLLHFTAGAASEDVSDYCGNIPDYYWREYRGIIPRDAVPGGTDKTGLSTYVGQGMVFPHGLMPASIYHNSKIAIASGAGKKFYIDKNVKILCSSNLRKFRWVPTNIDKIQLITNCHLILGGVENGHQENVGRVNFEEQVILGKVIRKPLDNIDGLYVPTNETEVRFTTFEVLAFDCKPGTNGEV